MCKCAIVPERIQTVQLDPHLNVLSWYGFPSLSPYSPPCRSNDSCCTSTQSTPARRSWWKFTQRPPCRFICVHAWQSRSRPITLRSSRPVRYRGVTTITRCPCAASACGRLATTSPSPPVLLYGAASDATKTTWCDVPAPGLLAWDARVTTGRALLSAAGCAWPRAAGCAAALSTVARSALRNAEGDCSDLACISARAASIDSAARDGAAAGSGDPDSSASAADGAPAAPAAAVRPAVYGGPRLGSDLALGLAVLADDSAIGFGTVCR